MYIQGKISKKEYNYLKMYRIIFCILLFLAFILSCKKKEAKVELIPNNTAPYYDSVPRVKIENYVNRLFIDIIGREPFDSEMLAETNNLINTHIAISTREALITKLQSDQTYIAGDSSYAIAANKRWYDLLSVRLTEGFIAQDFMKQYGMTRFSVMVDSLNGNWASYYKNKLACEQLLNAANSKWDYYHKIIDIEDFCARLINNPLTFEKTDSYMANEDNTILYTFNDLFFRQSTQSEFQIARDMILNGKSGILFGKSGHSKGDYMTILTHCNEFYEGTVKWLYKTFLARFPTAEETLTNMISLPIDKDIRKIQRNILKTDEYANF